ncbi:MAG: hypothetical protein V1755_06425 [Chloroflexota bacterium]
MARSATDDVLDNGLDSMKAAVDAVAGTMVICEGEPTTYSHASQNKGTGDGKVLATKTNPTLTVADDTSGRKCTVSAAAGNAIAVSGTADHIALTDGSAKLWFVTTCTGQALVAAGTVDVPAWKVNVKDPTAP